MTALFKRWGIVKLALLTLALVAAALLFMIPEAAQAPGSDTAGTDPTPAPAAEALENGVRLLSGCQIVQTMGFSRCGHSVTRRISLPSALTGADFAAAQAYYGLWQIDAFSVEQVVMTREIALFCPMHQVLTANEAGEIVLTRNVYGDGMAVVKNLGVSLSELAQDDREEMILGLAFDSEADAERWLENARKDAPGL